MKYPKFTGWEPCTQVGIEWFFIDDRQYKEAKMVCRSCDMIVECAKWGIKHEMYGVFGGLSPHERKNLRVKHRIPFQEPHTGFINNRVLNLGGDSEGSQAGERSNDCAA